ncbi:SDR family oxidoreductase [Neorhizobium vignae]|uniref:SDR family oxidoreductase n=1 Tax=Neorhizobium vignae TaxID=690585 RepID=UPI001FCC814F|nr:SDR family oxidoreductase [Neorhizobium vignae]
MSIYGPRTLGKRTCSRARRRRLGQPRDIASAVSFIASDEAGWITGEALIVAGGAGM